MDNTKFECLAKALSEVTRIVIGLFGILRVVRTLRKRTKRIKRSKSEEP